MAPDTGDPRQPGGIAQPLLRQVRSSSLSLTCDTRTLRRGSWSVCWLWRERCGTWTTWPHDPLVDLGQMHVNKHLVGILSLPWGGGRRGGYRGGASGSLQSPRQLLEHADAGGAWWAKADSLDLDGSDGPMVYLLVKPSTPCSRCDFIASTL